MPCFYRACSTGGSGTASPTAPRPSCPARSRWLRRADRRDRPDDVGSYSSTMDVCGLTVEPSRWRALAVRATTRREIRLVPPRRGVIRPNSTGLRVRLRLAPGQEPADVAASAERLRHA
jgi:hypothetical protein